MSERLNSVDIEDVLSSIRRLVSDDKRPMAQAAPTAAAVAPPVDPQADKLILTPALRIAPEPEPEPAPAPVAETPAAPANPAMTEAPVAFHSIRGDRGGDAGSDRLDAVMGQVARGLDAGQGDWEAPVEPPSHFASDWTSSPAEAAATGAGMRAETWPDEMTEVPFADLSSEPDADIVSFHPAGEVLDPDGSADVSARPGEVDFLHGAGADDPVAADAAGGAVSEPDFPVDRLPDSWPTPDWPAPDWAGVGADVPASATVTDAPWDDVLRDTTAPVAMAEEPAMIDKDEPADPPHIDTATAEMPDWARMEAEAEAAPHTAGHDPRWADAAEAEIRRELEEEVTASAFARFADDDLDDRPFDEDMLRDLVRDIIREELQGALGERITRNVRKLVRAEIARALAVRDFE